MRKTDKWIFRDFSKGEVIFRAGEEGDEAYVVHKGIVEVISDHNGEEKVIETLTQTDFLGEMALIDNKPRSATAIAKEDAVLVVFTKEEIERSLAKSDPLTVAIVNLLTKRLRKTVESTMAVT